MKNIVVIGSINVDYSFKLDHLPLMGETILAKKSFKSNGGKGANQAIALAKLGAKVTMIGAIGKDTKGMNALKNLNSELVNTENILIKDNVETGFAFICLDYKGNNTIVVNPGANHALTIKDIEINKDVILNAEFCLMQLEIPLDVISYATKLCNKNGVKVILNPAPAASDIPDEILKRVDYLIPNETELGIMTSTKVTTENVVQAGRKLISKGTKAVIVTMGEKGAFYIDSETSFHVPAYPVKAVDTTAAGDSFIGGFLSSMALKKGLKYSLDFASKVASITVNKSGAAESIPRYGEIR